MKLASIHNVYFLGIGGIGMSALARWFHANGYAVTGYDKTATVLTEKLSSQGIGVHYDDDISCIPSEIREANKSSLVIYTPAIPHDLEQYQFFIKEKFELLKRSQVLGLLTASKYTIAIAGTHGKTTTSSMVAHLLKSAGINCSAFVGGIMTNYDSNLLIGTNDEVMVVEADEFDRSFLTLHPDMAVITAIDTDHLDIYSFKEAFNEAFNEFIKKIKANGHLFVEETVANELELNPNGNINVSTYHLKTGDITAENLCINARDVAIFDFDYQSTDRSIKGLQLALPGFHNVSNAIAAISTVKNLVKNDNQIVAGINSYAGVKRRFEYIINTPKLIFIDDYAHHPEEIRALLSSVGEMYPLLTITVIFQPHLFTRTKDFSDGFADSLSLADEVILLDIYPAREMPIEGVSSEIIKHKMKGISVHSFVKDDVLEYFNTHTPELLLTIGAGDIDTLVLPIKEKLLKI